ncbi:MAG: hypothetical protein WA741_12880 [Candidatus Sulfotelmatobacter sp.]
MNRRLQDEARKREEFVRKQQANGVKGGRPAKNPGLSSGFPQGEANDEARESSAVSSIQSSTDTGTATVTRKQEDSTEGEQEDNRKPIRSTDTDTVLVGDWADQLKMDETDQRKFKAVMHWKETLSNYWKGKPLFSLKAYRKVEEQYDKFYAKLPAGKKPHDLPVQASHRGGPRKLTETEMAARDSAELDRACNCAKPTPDCNGNDAFAYGISCARCGGWLRLPNEVEHDRACTFLENVVCSCGLDDLTEQLKNPKFQEWLESNAIPVNDDEQPASRSKAFEIED